MNKYLAEIESDGLSITGPIREDNQDAIHLPDTDRDYDGSLTGLLYAIADGMGGYSHGSVASSLALEALTEAVVDVKVPNPAKALSSAVENANLEVYKAAQRLAAGRMGTTLTAAFVRGDTLYLAHVGDSRAYLIREKRAICLTVDHTAVSEMVRSKLLSADKIRTHAQRSVLTKAIGLALFIQPDITQHRLQENDCLILCSDGIWSVIEDDEFAKLAVGTPVDRISRNLVELALQRGTDDNASVVVFRLSKLVPAPAEPPGRKEGGWFQGLRKLMHE